MDSTQDAVTLTGGRLACGRGPALASAAKAETAVRSTLQRPRLATPRRRRLDGLNLSNRPSKSTIS